MLHQIKYPSPLLSGYVKYYWIMESHADIGERVVPTDDVQMIFHYGRPFKENNPDGSSERQHIFSICGMLTGYKDVVAEGSCGMIGVIFYPWAAMEFLGLPMSELTDRTACLEDISRDFGEYEHRLSDAVDNQERINLIEKMILRRLGNSRFIHSLLVKESVRLIGCEKGRLKPAELSHLLNISERQFERAFLHGVGVSPRQFIEIARFGHSMKLLKSSLSLTQVAYEAGYYDQSRFNKVILKYSGMTPGQIRKRYGSERI